MASFAFAPTYEEEEVESGVLCEPNPYARAYPRERLSFGTSNYLIYMVGGTGIEPVAPAV
jgi:hypothetical protein